MNLRDYLLSLTLMLLIGCTAGIAYMLLTQESGFRDFADVQVTEVKRSDQPLISPSDLEKIDERFLFRAVAERVVPSVVFIEVSSHYASDDDSIWDRIMPYHEQSLGSGVIISDDGYILTNDHVIEGAVDDGIQVTLHNRKTYRAVLIGSDPSTDIAVIKIQARDLQSIIVGNSDRLHVGDWVMAVGNPFRLRSTVTAGIVSATGRDVQVIEDPYRIESFIQTDAAINRGNSGGALVNTSGELIGINTAIATERGNYQGYGFAVPSNLAFKVARDLIEFGSVRRGLLGVTIQSVDSHLAEREGLQQVSGVLITNVAKSSAAEEGGVKESDIILKVNQKRVHQTNELQEQVALFRPGEQLTLTLWRNGEELERSIQLKEFAMAISAFGSGRSDLPEARAEEDPSEEGGENEQMMDEGGAGSPD